MPTYDITAPGGQKYRVTAPEGASESDALAYVRNNHDKLQALPATPTPAVVPAAEAPTTLGRLERVGRELAQPLVGMEQIAGRILPIPVYQDGKWVSRAQADDAAAKANEARINALRGGATGPNWEQLGLDMINPLNYAGGPAAKALGVAPKAATALMGAAAGLTQPVTNGGSFWTQKGEQAALGAAAGRVGEAAGKAAGKVIAPKLDAAQRYLTDRGVRMTPGELAGKGWKRAEDAISSIPVVGSFIRNAQLSSIEDFNRAALNEGLQHIGVRVPNNVPAGREAINYADAALKAAYNRVLPNMVLQADSTFQGEVTNMLSLAKGLPPDMQAEFKRVLQHDVMSRFSAGGGMTGQTVQEIGETLDGMANTLRQGKPDERRLGGAIKEVDAMLDRALERQNPALAPEKQKIDLAYAYYKTAQKASAMQGAKDGTFTPAQLSNAVRSRDTSKDKADYARGFGLLQEFASNGEKTLSRSLPDSGTAERRWYGTLASGAGVAAFSPKAALGIGASTLPYTKPGLAAIRAYASPSASRNSARLAAEELAPYLSATSARSALGAYQDQKK